MRYREKRREGDAKWDINRWSCIERPKIFVKLTAMSKIHLPHATNSDVNTSRVCVCTLASYMLRSDSRRLSSCTSAMGSRALNAVTGDDRSPASLPGDCLTRLTFHLEDPRLFYLPSVFLSFVSRELGMQNGLCKRSSHFLPLSYLLCIMQTLLLYLLPRRHSDFFLSYSIPAFIYNFFLFII